jgi:hypothetical protein
MLNIKKVPEVVASLALHAFKKIDAPPMDDPKVQPSKTTDCDLLIVLKSIGYLNFRHFRAL